MKFDMVETKLDDSKLWHMSIFNNFISERSVNIDR